MRSLTNRWWSGRCCCCCFQDCSHAFSDEEMMKRKVQSIVDCFLDSVYSPTLQVSLDVILQHASLLGFQLPLNGERCLEWKKTNHSSSSSSSFLPFFIFSSSLFVFSCFLIYTSNFHSIRDSINDLNVAPYNLNFHSSRDSLHNPILTLLTWVWTVQTSHSSCDSLRNPNISLRVTM